MGYDLNRVAVKPSHFHRVSMGITVKFHRTIIPLAASLAASGTLIYINVTFLSSFSLLVKIQANGD